MTKIKCKGGVCKLVPGRHTQSGSGLQPRPLYYLVPINESKVPKAKKTKPKQTGSGNVSKNRKPAKKGGSKKVKAKPKTKAKKKNTSKSRSVKH